ncbi:hypothetical protein ACE103_21680 [Bradyrhizobium sp. ma5]|uniref:hypothetical protein n=1 Tax=unclassified Bradyrhizobium TaxID=2631580 RepID=UPI001CC7454D|nr:hypothetical protein [Bradyrhizobium sp. RD5-C2]
MAKAFRRSFDCAAFAIFGSVFTCGHDRHRRVADGQQDILGATLEIAEPMMAAPERDG